MYTLGSLFVLYWLVGQIRKMVVNFLADRRGAKAQLARNRLLEQEAARHEEEEKETAKHAQRAKFARYAAAQIEVIESALALSRHLDSGFAPATEFAAEAHLGLLSCGAARRKRHEAASLGYRFQA
jgi:hypothetical protein